MTDWKKIQKIAGDYGSKNKADVLFYNGLIEKGFDFRIIDLCGRRNKRKNILFILVTSGGDAHAAYRMARSLQQNYEKVTVFVPGWCKSAGTLLAVGAHEIIMSDLGEMGPIDVQRAKQDDLWESSSGLTEDAAIETLEEAAWKMFYEFIIKIKDISGGQVTFKTAADAVAPVVVGGLAPIFAQIDPLKIGENSRAMRIASDYGKRLNLHAHNLKSRKSIENLVSSYSSHGFVIDRREATELFNNVSEPTKQLEELCQMLGKGAVFPLDEEKPPIIKFLNKTVVRRKSARTTTTAKRGQASAAQQGKSKTRTGSGKAAVHGGNTRRTASQAAPSSESNVTPIQGAGDKRLRP